VLWLYTDGTERARSLSPDKPSTPQSAVGTPRNIEEKAASTPTPAMAPSSRQDVHDDSLQRLTGSPATLLEDTEPKKPAPSAAALGRSGTLSWQRRPQSGSIRRPLSMAAPSSRDNSEPSSPERAPSRDQIAQSLGAKDPSWFKQTPDRGVGSAAYRRNQDDNASETGSMSGRRQLPGLSRETTVEPEPTSPPPESVRSSSSLRGSAALNARFSGTSTIAAVESEGTSKARSPLPVLESQKFAPPSEPGSSVDGGDRTGAARGLAMSPTQGRISPERPASPTKGMGGFVQSAMLKRSDSVSKRWSAQVPATLSRQNSTLSNRGSTYGTLPKPDSRPTSLSRDNSMEPSSRPGSSSSNMTITKDAAKGPVEGASRTEFAKPALPHHSRSKSVASTFSEPKEQHEDTSPPSPSKRWSPSKSSWLESALNKPESPKLKQPPPAQPAWMSEISRIKQQRGSVDMGKGSPFQSPPLEPTSGRSSPIKDVKLKPTSLRRSESPNKEAHTEAAKLVKPAEPSPKPKPVLSPKPSIAATREMSPPQEPEASEVSIDATMDAPEATTSEPTSPTRELSEQTPPSAPAPAEKPKPLSSVGRFAKDSPLSSPAAKAKPDTPPKKDFRANLKSRQLSDTPKNSNVSELQSVFGKLRKAETKNYVAPDTLKDNILRGKSGLAVTGGPKPSVRRDEFRDSLVTKKAAMLAKAQEEGSAAHKRADSASKPAETPEALAMRKNLGRAESFSNAPAAKEKEADATPEAISRLKSIRSSKPVPAEKPEQSQTPVASRELPRTIQQSPTRKEGPSVSSLVGKELPKNSKLAGRFNPALANMLARGPPSMASKPGGSTESADSGSKPADEEPTKSAPELTHMTKGRARGPKRRTPAAKQTAKTGNNEKEEAEKVNPIASVPLVKAEHILPSSQPFQTSKTDEDFSVTRTPVRDSLKEKPLTPSKSPELTRKLEKSPTPEPPKKPASLELNRRVSSDVHAAAKKSPFSKPVETPKKPIIQSKDVSTRSPVPAVQTPPTNGKANPSVSSRPLPVPPVRPETHALKEISPPNTEVTPVRQTPSPEKSTFSVKGATSLWSRQSASSSPAPARVRSPIKLPTRADEEAAMETAGLRSAEPTDTAPLQPRAPKPKPVGLGLGSLGSLGGFVAAKSRESSPPKPYSPKQSPLSPPMSGGRPQSEPFKASPAPEKPQGLFAEFFDEMPVTTGELPEGIDTVHILKNPPYDSGPNGKIRTLRKQIHEITGDGKLISVPVQEEHVLYQDCMYLCTHVFGDSRGARLTEVYLWSGNGVAEPTLDDVQVFARNYARQQQGKLTTMRQGKETPNFFDALGGIVITRRGSNANPTQRAYMLCGRRHLGHIAFDEVDYSLKSLCSGFAYIISTESGKVYLWKGKGSGAEELSGARLMGMDLTPTGEFLEVDEGSEPQELFNVFPPSEAKGPAIPRSADHWRYKAKADRYQVRLYKIEQQQSSGWGSLQVSAYFPALLRRPSWQFSRDTIAERPQTPSTPKSLSTTTKVVEIMPFAQRDLEPEHIYVLDAFFEMYM
jgi:hypothetical protein